MTEWRGSTVLVTGGASFIGSHLVDALVARGSHVRVADDLSSGIFDNIRAHVQEGRVDFRHVNLADERAAADAVKGVDIVFHLAADHGGRGYIDTHQVACAGNLVLDGVVFRACRAARVQKVVYASSGCVYPKRLQGNPREEVYLTEEMVGPPYEADDLYGWAKLMGEMTLRAGYAESGTRAACCRYFTVYGERGNETHAITAMIARAFVQEDPFVVWGDGEQIRSWVHVSDVVEGTLLAAETIDDGSAVNIGTTERMRVIDAAREVLRLTGHRAEIAFQPGMPTGPINRAPDISRARTLLGWSPKVSFTDGLRRTIDWYFSSKDREQVRSSLQAMLTSR
jgi:nucleoside-diphosphate-sugar epimerase